ncbi:MAG: Rieske (2Fe-2S) protein [Sphingobacteriales bacterium]|nr:MAG: Rieske (2Fe-2S) protein [Sphingobacteriales bacterium]
MYNWLQAEGITIHTLEENKPTETIAGEKRIGLLKKGDMVYAFSATCPHASAPLCDGWLDAQGRIVCPLHKYRFDLANGRNTSGEGYKLKTYPVEVREEYIYIGFI